LSGVWRASSTFSVIDVPEIRGRQAVKKSTIDNADGGFFRAFGRNLGLLTHPHILRRNRLCDENQTKKENISPQAVRSEDRPHFVAFQFFSGRPSALRVKRYQNRQCRNWRRNSQPMQ
jgi:hypothetical protein